NNLTQQHHLARFLFTDDAGQEHGCYRRKDAELDFRLAEPSALTRNHNVAGGYDLATATERRPLNYPHDRLRDLMQRAKDRVKRIEHLEHSLSHVLLNGNARAKGPRPFGRI